MKVLLIGHGGREHALGWKLSQSPLLESLYMTGENPGLLALGEAARFDVTRHSEVVDFCHEKSIDLVVVGPEAPLVDGLVDTLEGAGFLAFGPSKQAAQLEGSKTFVKELCRKNTIPTADYTVFDNLTSAKTHVQRFGAPLVIKADGLAAGKGVTVALNINEALSALEECFSGEFGDAGTSVVIEEMLIGEEASLFVICDGENYITLDSAQDHKRVGDGDTGPNTGGMGAYSPAAVVSDLVLERALTQIIEPTLAVMKDRGTPFKGVLYAGLMIENNVPKLIEYNCRFGDPECQVLMMRLKSDLLPILLAAAKGELEGKNLNWHDDNAMTVVMAAKGYPSAPSKGGVIKGLEKITDDPDVIVFQAGTKKVDGNIVANGGRVLNVTAKGTDLSVARRKAYDAISKIEWSDGFCRSDIGWRALGSATDD